MLSRLPPTKSHYRLPTTSCDRAPNLLRLVLCERAKNVQEPLNGLVCECLLDESTVAHGYVHTETGDQSLVTTPTSSLSPRGAAHPFAHASGYDSVKKAIAALRRSAGDDVVGASWCSSRLNRSSSMSGRFRPFSAARAIALGLCRRQRHRMPSSRTTLPAKGSALRHRASHAALAEATSPVVQPIGALRESSSVCDLGTRKPRGSNS